MKKKNYLLSFLSTTIIFVSLLGCNTITQNNTNESFISYTANPHKQNIKFFWKNDSGKIYKSLGNLKEQLAAKNKKLIFAMNGGMYKVGNVPQGLYIKNNITLNELDTLQGKGNFYLQPNGIFYIRKNGSAEICPTAMFKNDGSIKYATQSGPMLVKNGSLHPAFKENSANLNIRNGVGILPNNEIIFAMSKNKINFYNFAMFFKDMGCKNALYLDGLVSRTYLPGKGWEQTDGDFGVMIGITE